MQRPKTKKQRTTANGEGERILTLSCVFVVVNILASFCEQPENTFDHQLNASWAFLIESLLSYASLAAASTSALLSL